MAIYSSFTYQKCGLSISYVSLLVGKHAISFPLFEGDLLMSLSEPASDFSAMVFLSVSSGLLRRLKWSRIVKNDGGLMKYWNYTEGI